MKVMGKIKLNSPTANSLRNPLKGGTSAKSLREKHRKALKLSGVDEPRSPLR